MGRIPTGARVEKLETRRLLAATVRTAPASGSTVDGVVFDDRNIDGVHQPSEPPLAGITAYLDANDNRKLDAGEKTSVTDSAGRYSITNHAGLWVIRQVLQPGWHQTTPIGNLGQHVWLRGHMQIHGRDFGQARDAQLWGDFGGDAQHTAISATPSQALKK